MSQPMGPLVTLGETMGLLTSATLGRLHRGQSLRLGIAGAESNVAIGVRRLGGQAMWMGRVSEDAIGDLILQEMRAEDVAVHATRDPAPNGLMMKVNRSADIVRVLYFRIGSAGSRLCPQDLDEKAIATAGVLHLTGITPALGDGPAAAVHAAIEIARANGVTISFDVNYRAALWSKEAAAAELRELVSKADVVFAGEEEAKLFVEADTPAGMSTALTALGPSQAIVTCGARGSVATVGGLVYEQPPIQVRVIDPVGAGDAFVAGYLAGILDGHPVEARLAAASASGAFAVTVDGDWEGLPSREDLAFDSLLDNVIR